MNNRVWRNLGLAPETRLHDVRYGENFTIDGKDEFVWVFEISSSVPPNHFAAGFAEALNERQPAVYFPLGGGSIKGISQSGEIVWSRIFVEHGRLNADLALGRSVALPAPGLIVDGR
jgi:hypothetical protein